MAAYFIMDYLFVYDDSESILEVFGDTIRTFLGNWYIRKFMSPRITEIKAFFVLFRIFSHFSTDRKKVLPLIINFL